MLKKRHYIPVMMVLMLFSAYAFAGIDGDISKSFKVGTGGQLTLETDLGAVEVETHNKNSVEVEVKFRPRRRGRDRMLEIMEDFDIEFDQRGDDVIIIMDCGRDRYNFWDNVGRYVEVEFFITVPTKYNVELQTAGGSIEVADLEGEVDAHTSGGSLGFGNIKGPVIGKTSGGSITLEGCEGDADVKTSGGSIRIGRVAGEVVAHTSGGGIQVEEVMGTIDAKTSGGSVTATISKQPADDCQLKTSGGSVTVYLAEGINVDVDASTSGGRVRTDFPVTVRGEINGRSLRAKINDGGPELYLRTSGGSINIKEM